MKVNKQSWHYRIFLLSRGASYRIDLDSCQYIKSVIQQLAIMIWVAFILICISSVILTTIWKFFVWMIGCMFTEVCSNPSQQVIYGAMFSVTGVSILLIACFAKIFLNGEVREHQSSFVSQAFDRFKNKYCSKIEVI